MPGYGKHETLGPTLAAAAREVGREIEVTWIRSRSLARDPAHVLEPFHAAVASPQDDAYCDDPGALLDALALIPGTGLPCLAICGGAQLALRAGARQIADLPMDAPMLRPVECRVSGSGMERQDDGSGFPLSGQHPVRLLDGCRAARAYGRLVTRESFACSYALDRSVVGALGEVGVAAVGTTPGVGVTVFEWPASPFCMATLFLPQWSREQPHPLVTELLRAGAEARGMLLRRAEGDV